MHATMTGKIVVNEHITFHLPNMVLSHVLLTQSSLMTVLPITAYLVNAFAIDNTIGSKEINLDV